MGDIHDLVLKFGVQQARTMVPPAERHLVDIAADLLADESDALAITYAGFCLTSLPHRALKDDNACWQRSNGRFTLLVEPGKIYEGRRYVHYGIPYGSRARLILLYLQTRALQTGSRRVELGRSMYHWMGRLGIAVGGKSYEQVRNQAKRLSSCRLTVGWTGEDGSEGFARENLVSGMLTMPSQDDQRQGVLWTEEAELTETFMRALVSHPVPVLESAVRRISNQSMALDIYVWLSYRLRSLSKPTPVRWAALQLQFGPEFNSLKNFRQHFRYALKEALTVYPDAEVDVTARGLLLKPSASPVPERPPRSPARLAGAAGAPTVIALERRRWAAS